MNKLTVGSLYSGFRLNEIRPLSELSVEMYTFEHEQSGARLIYLQADDDNKVFYVGFRTTPVDSTGVFHILEHSVLCGSEKYPVKEPFVDLIKGSMNTFLNAMTYPDKTVYPVASCNDKDFANLMSVYMDATFRPNVHTRPQIFLQEGWHTEIDENGTASCKGVVYNEMKGSFASVDTRNFEAVKQALFPDTCYRHCSGGNPVNIPDLSYEQFKDAHNTFYHPENSYMFLYGDMDVTERLAFLNDEYLCKYQRINKAIPIALQKPVQCMDKVTYYPAAESDKEEESAYLAYAAVTGTYADTEENLAMSILFEAIASGNDSPLKKKFMESGMGQDFYAYVMDGIAQPFALFQLRKTSADKKDEFYKLLIDTLTDYAENGLDHQQIAAVLHQTEFHLRRGNNSGSPAGLGYGLTMLDTWLYGGDPAAAITFEKALENMKAGLENGYFENLLKTKVLGSKHTAFVSTLPSYTLAKEEAEAEAARFAALKASMTEEEVAATVKQMQDLIEYQSSGDTPEDKATLPKLALSDIREKGTELPIEITSAAGVTLLNHELFTKKISYLKYYFDLSGLTPEELPYASLLSELLGNISTASHTAAELRCEIGLKLGEFSCGTGSHPLKGDTDHCLPQFTVHTATMDDEIAYSPSIVKEVLTSTLMKKDEIGMIVLQSRNGNRMRYINSGNSAALGEIFATLSADGACNVALHGLSYYRFLCDLADHFDERYDALAAKLNELCEKIFTKANLTLSLTAEGQLPKMDELMASFDLPAGGEKPAPLAMPKSSAPAQGIAIPSGVCYVAEGGSYLGTMEYSGSMQVLSKILTYDYLWNEVRVKGGAYGIQFGANATGAYYMASYRDPAAAPTLAAYAAIPAYLRSFETAESVDQYIISTMAGVDRPMSASQKGAAADSHYFEGVTEDFRQKTRAEILATTPAQIAAYADKLEALMQSATVCAVGNKEKLEAAGLETIDL
ncbi:MAG: insulinase family protein [Clostridia bacterium]|nr:insulinase family protein [Clostridia bacterium]